MQVDQDNRFPFRGGVASSLAMLQAGFTKPVIRNAVAAGRLIRIRQGWYSLPSPHEAVRRAVSAGGVLGCQSALRFWGVWTPDTCTIHVRRSQYGRRHSGSTAAKFCQPHGILPAPKMAVDDVLTALRTATLCSTDTELVVLMDSLFNVGLLDPTRLRYGFADLSAHHRALVDRCDRAESGTETMTRLALRARGIKVRPQVWVDGVGRVDFLVGQCLVIEVDSRAHHTDPENYHRDRLRDQRLVSRGYIVIRLTYEQVMFDLAATIERIVPLIARGAHRRPVQIYGDT